MGGAKVRNAPHLSVFRDRLAPRPHPLCRIPTTSTTSISRQLCTLPPSPYTLYPRTSWDHDQSKNTTDYVSREHLYLCMNYEPASERAAGRAVIRTAAAVRSTSSRPSLLYLPLWSSTVVAQIPLPLSVLVSCLVHNGNNFMPSLAYNTSRLYQVCGA